MPNMPEPQVFGVPDDDSPEWTRETFARAVRFPDFPPQLKDALDPNGTNQPVSLPVAAEVLEAVKKSGPGWQQRAERVLRAEFMPSKNAA